MCLHLQVVATVEQVRIPLGGLAGALVVVCRQVPGDLTRHTRGRDDDPFLVLREHFPIDTRLVVEALRIPDRRQLDEVLVPYTVPR